MSRPSVLLLLVALVAACTAAPDAAVAPTPTAPQPPPGMLAVRVGTGPEPESTLLGHVLVELLHESGIPAEIAEYADAPSVRRALELGDVDVQVGYTGEAWLRVLGRADPPSDARTSFARVREHDEDDGILWQPPVFSRARGLDQPPADATFAFVVQGAPGVHADLRTMSDLARRLSQDPDAQLCVDPEFGRRPDGLQAVLDAYDIRRDVEVFGAAPADAVLGVAAGFCIAGLTTATDGAAWLRGQRPLRDDIGVFPAFVVAPLVRDDVRSRYAGILAAIAPFGNGLTTQRLGEWNAQVQAGIAIEQVASEAAFTLLEVAGRLPASRPTGTPTRG